MNQIDWDQYLLKASEDGDLEKAKRAIENGADVNTTGFLGETPLHLASMEGHEAVVSLLLEKGANVNAEADDGKDSNLSFRYCWRKVPIQPLPMLMARLHCKSK